MSTRTTFLGMAFLLVLTAYCAPGARAADAGNNGQALGTSNQPIHITADQAVFNRKKNTGTYTGSVKVDQGRLHLRGDKLVVTQHTGKKSSFTGIMTGDPATLVQDPEKPGQNATHSRAKKITYNSATQTLNLDEDAHITQGNNALSGEHIVYDLSTRKIQASRSKGQQVHITLYPGQSPNSPDSKGNK